MFGYNLTEAIAPMKKPSKRPKKNASKKTRKTLRSPAEKKTKVLKKLAKKSAQKKQIKKKAKKPLKFLPDNEIRQSLASNPMPKNMGPELPNRYGEDKLVLLVRDPWWLYTYWEVTPQNERSVHEKVKRSGEKIDRTVLRVYDVTEAAQNKNGSFFDIEIANFSDNWYVDVGSPDRDWVAELGIRSNSGAFYPMLRSNTVRTPRYGVSDVVDEEWMMPDELYWQLLGRSGGLWDAKSSLEVRRYLMRYLKSNVSSEASRNLSKPVHHQERV